MNEHTLTIGDRVRIRAVASGYAAMYVGATGRIKRIEPMENPFDSVYGSRYRYGVPRRVLRFLVELDGVRPEQVHATRVEKITEPVVSAGDRVRILEGWVGGTSATRVGQLGTLVGQEYRGGRVQHTVSLEDGSGSTLAAAVQRVEPADKYDPPTAAVGDRVVILRGDGVGRLGKVARVTEPGKVGGETIPRHYIVRTDIGREALATKVAPAPSEPATAAEPLADWERELLSGSPTPAAKTIESAPLALPIDRLQASSYAHGVLGSRASLDDLIRLSEWVLGRPTTQVTVAPGHVEWRDVPAVDLDEELVLTDGDGDTVRVDGDVTADEGVVIVVTPGAGAYVRADDLDRLIAYLQGHRDRIRR